MVECGGLSGQDDEHRLRDLLSDVPVVDIPQRCRINKVDVLGDQLPKGHLIARLNVNL